MKIFWRESGRTSALFCAQSFSRSIFCAVGSTLGLMCGVSYKREDWGWCCGAIGYAEGIEDTGRRCYEGRRCRYRCADGREYPWEQHGRSVAGEGGHSRLQLRLFEISAWSVRQLRKSLVNVQSQALTIVSLLLLFQTQLVAIISHS